MIFHTILTIIEAGIIIAISGMRKVRLRKIV